MLCGMVNISADKLRGYVETKYVGDRSNIVIRLHNETHSASQARVFHLLCLIFKIPIFLIFTDVWIIPQHQDPLQVINFAPVLYQHVVTRYAGTLIYL